MSVTVGSTLTNEKSTTVTRTDGVAATYAVGCESIVWPNTMFYMLKLIAEKVSFFGFTSQLTAGKNAELSEALANATATSSELMVTVLITLPC